jgi:hypothetical protein
MLSTANGLAKATTAIAAAAVVIDPTVKVAIIAGVALVLANLPTFILGMLQRKDSRQIKASQSDMADSVNGHFTRLLNKQDADAASLAAKSEELARATGRREGVEATEQKPGTVGDPIK